MSKRLPPPPAETLAALREYLTYDKSTGEIRWAKYRGGSGRKAGDLAGYVDCNGYRTIRFRGRLYLACHLAWFLATGEWPTCTVDHKNLNASDDRLENLRLATHSQNIAHAGLP